MELGANSSSYPPPPPSHAGWALSCGGLGSGTAGGTGPRPFGPRLEELAPVPGRTPCHGRPDGRSAAAPAGAGCCVTTRDRCLCYVEVREGGERLRDPPSPFCDTSAEAPHNPVPSV